MVITDSAGVLFKLFPGQLSKNFTFTPDNSNTVDHRIKPQPHTQYEHHWAGFMPIILAQNYYTSNGSIEKNKKQNIRNETDT